MTLTKKQIVTALFLATAASSNIRKTMCTPQSDLPSKITKNKTDNEAQSDLSPKTPSIKEGIWGTDTLGANVIYFYDKHDDSYFLTNFAPYPITIDGITWPTSEHYFQAMKFPDHKELQEKIQKAPKASDAKKLANKKEHKLLVRKDWHAVSLDLMIQALTAKFNQNEETKKLLLATGNKKLVEASPVDSFWAAGKDGNGKNHLGIILMQIRDELKKK